MSYINVDIQVSIAVKTVHVLLQIPSPLKLTLAPSLATTASSENCNLLECCVNNWFYAFVIVLVYAPLLQ